MCFNRRIVSTKNKTKAQEHVCMDSCFDCKCNCCKLPACLHASIDFGCAALLINTMLTLKFGEQERERERDETPEMGKAKK